MQVGDRSTGDLLILAFAVTVCAAVLAAGAGITWIRLARPEQDVSVASAALVGIINTMTGVVAGYLAGRADRAR